MELEQLISFIVASIILTIMPGPDNIFVLTESLTKGTREGLYISFGLIGGVVMHTTAAATGLSIILKQSEILFLIVKYLGVLYMLWMAWGAYRDRGAPVDIDIDKVGVRGSFTTLFRRGFLMNILNPKVALFFIAFLPQFVVESDISTTIQMFILGALFMSQGLVIFSLIAILAGRMTKILKSPNFWRVTRYLKIVTLLVIAFMLAI